MNYKMSSEFDEKILNKIIDAAYGKAPIKDRIQVKLLIKKDSKLKRLFEEYQNTANTVHLIELEEYRKNEKTALDSPVKEKPTLLEQIYSIFWNKPFVYTAAVTALFISIMFSVFSNREITFNGYTLAEVEKANMESKFALSIVADIFSDTEKKLKTEILLNEVSRPINDGIKTVNKLFKKEIKE